MMAYNKKLLKTLSILVPFVVLAFFASASFVVASPSLQRPLLDPSLSAQPDRNHFRDLFAELLPLEYSHPLGQTRVVSLARSGIVANPRYGAIKSVGDTIFMAQRSDNQSVTLDKHPVFASQSGYFYLHGMNSDGTARVFVRHLNNSKTYYSHLDRQSVVFNDGVPVRRGEIIGFVSGEQFGFSIIDHRNIPKPSNFEDQHGKQLLSSVVNTSRKVYSFMREDMNKQRQQRIRNELQLAQSAPPNAPMCDIWPCVPPDDGTYCGDPSDPDPGCVSPPAAGACQLTPDGEVPDPPPEGCPGVIPMPELCEIVECEDVEEPEQGEMDPPVHYREPELYPKPFEALKNTRNYTNSPTNLATDYCPPAVRRALNEKQTAGIDYDERMRIQHLSRLIDFKSATCFNLFTAKILGPISKIFSQSGGDSLGFLNRVINIARDLGITVPIIDGQLPVLGDVLDGINNILGGGCAGFDPGGFNGGINYGSLGRVIAGFKENIFTSIGSVYGEPVLGTGYGMDNQWRTRISNMFGKPTQRYIDAANLGRYFDGSRYTIIDNVIRNHSQQ